MRAMDLLQLDEIRIGSRLQGAFAPFQTQELGWR